MPRSIKLVLAMTVLAVVLIPAGAVAMHQFTDVPDSNIFHADIDWLADNGITLGCNPPINDRYCPGDNVTREQMAAFMRRLAVNQVVDADKLDGKDSAAYYQHGTIVTSVDGSAWLPHNLSPTTFDRFVTVVEASGDGVLVSPLVAPASIGGDDYGLHELEICMAQFRFGGSVSQIEVFRTNAALDRTAVFTDLTVRNTDGCFTYTVDVGVGHGLGVTVETAGGAGARMVIGTITATWTTGTASLTGLQGKDTAGLSGT